MPKSPCTTWPSQIRILLRQRQVEAHLVALGLDLGEVAFGGIDIAAGSTGSSRRTQNSSTETTSRIGDGNQQAPAEEMSS